MTTFTIDIENCITAYTAAPADATDCEVFASEKDLAKLSATWPSARLVEIWNSLTGVVPVKKFTDRKSAVTRIWKQIQYLKPAPPTPAKTAKKAAQAAPDAREGSKKAQVLDLLRRTNGATLNEVMTATGWQAHTVRGFISGTLTKKMGLAVESLRGEDKVRTYRVAG